MLLSAAATGNGRSLFVPGYSSARLLAGLPKLAIAIFLGAILLGVHRPASVLAQPRAGYYVSWDDCAAGLTDSSPACDAALGASWLHVWFVAGEDMQGITGATFTISALVVAGSLLDWWQFQPGGCRANLPYLDLGDGTSCLGLWRNQPSTMLTFQRGQRAIDIEA